jgi:hypothetical protein
MVANASGILRLEKKTFKSILEKVFFYIWSSFFLIWGFVSQNFFETFWVSENQEFYSDFKKINVPK